MAKRTRFSASISFETDTQPVRTHKTEIVATNAESAARLAVKSARKAFPQAQYRSVVVVLEKLGTLTVPGKTPAVHFGATL